MILHCLGLGSFMLLFELKTFAWSNVMLMPWLWHIRVVGYVGGSVLPIMFAHEIMPPLLPGIGFLIAGTLNLVEERKGEGASHDKTGELAERDGSTVRLKAGGAFYAPQPVSCLAVSLPLIVAGTQSGDLYHLKVQDGAPSA